MEKTSQGCWIYFDLLANRIPVVQKSGESVHLFPKEPNSISNNDAFRIGQGPNLGFVAVAVQFTGTVP
jgi:hypothetical protein